MAVTEVRVWFVHDEDFNTQSFSEAIADEMIYKYGVNSDEIIVQYSNSSLSDLYDAMAEL